MAGAAVKSRVAVALASAGVVLMPCAVSALAGSAAGGRGLPPVAVQVPRTDCQAAVGYSANATLDGYVVPDEQLGRTCVPFAQVQLPPGGYRGDYLVRQFSDARGRRLLADCRTHPPCGAVASAEGYRPTQFRVTGTVVKLGHIDPLAARVDLRKIRRPRFFRKAPYREGIARAESRAYTFEFSVPPEPYERLNRHLTRPDRLRGWYIRGAGVPNRRGRRVRALVILAGGRSVETTAVQDPRDPLYTRSATTGKYVPVSYPARGTEMWGARAWRGYLYKLYRAGFDVLSFDKRGHGISGDLSADNTLQQGLDMLRAIRALHTGRGVRTLGPNGVRRSGRRAVRALLHGAGALRMPILLGGASQGSMATDWAMNANFNRWCSLDLPRTPCHRPWSYRNIVGALELASFPVFAFQADAILLGEVANREIAHVVFIPTSEPLAHIRSWPSAFFAKGLWDELQGPWPTFNAYLRVRGPRELFLYRGPHSENEGGPANVALEQDRVTRFAVDVVLGRRHRGPRYRSLEAAIAASPPIWEPSTRPTFPSSP
jgi:hypothetical protein